MLNPKFEIRIPKQIRNTKIQIKEMSLFRILVIRILNLFRASDFGFRA